jgi:hypothetical protein
MMMMMMMKKNHKRKKLEKEIAGGRLREGNRQVLNNIYVRLSDVSVRLESVLFLVFTPFTLIWQIITKISLVFSDKLQSCFGYCRIPQ